MSPNGRHRSEDRDDEKNRSWTGGWLALAMLAWLLAAAPATAAENENSADEAASVLVATQMPAKGTLEQPVVAYGIVQPAPGGSVGIASLHAAQVIRLRVVQGQVVAKGEPLLDLGAEPAASLAYAQALSDRALAQGELGRTRQLLAERLATNSQLAQAEKAMKDAEATVQARQREGGQKPTETVTAPSAGVITSVAVSNGDHVQPGATLLDLAGSDGLIGLLGVAPESRARVMAHQAVQLVDMDARGQAIPGTILSVGGMADPKTGLFTAVARPAAGAPPLVAGTHLRAAIETAGVEGWIVPRDAVLTDDHGSYVFQIANGKAVRVAVAILGENAERLAVSGPVDAKMKLVVSGNYQLSDGMAVREQAANSEGAGVKPAAASEEKAK